MWADAFSESIGEDKILNVWVLLVIFHSFKLNMYGIRECLSSPPHSEFGGQIEFIQLCCNYFHFVLTSSHRYGVGDGRTFASPIAIFDAKSSRISCASIVLILFPIVLAPILRYEGVVFRVHPPLLRILEWKWSWSVEVQLCSIVQQSFLIVLALFLRFGHLHIICHLMSMTKVRLSSPSPLLLWILVSKLSQSIGFQLCSIVQQSFSIVLASFPRFGHLLIIRTLEVNDGSSSL